MTQLEADIAIIGAGPAGSTAAIELAQRGLRVVQLEKATHPRFHIGESLLPMNLPIFEHLGVLDRVREIGVHKPGAEFNGHDGQRQVFSFSNALDSTWSFAYQVRRSELDALLAQRAVEAGALQFQGHRVETVTLGGDSVELAVAGSQVQAVRAAFVLDASGRDTLFASRRGDKRRNAAHASAALFGHFANVRRREGAEAGLISIYWFAHGWYWMIPLRDGVMSVGAVCDPAYLKQRRVPPEEFFRQTLALGPPELRERMQQAQAVDEVRATGNYSYRSGAMSGQRYAQIGDAWAFIDPVFSSGVLLAMRSALCACDYAQARALGRAHAGQQRRRFEREVRRGIGEFSWLIARFNAPAMRRLFLNPGNLLRVRDAVTSVLAGDVFRDNGVRWRYRIFRWIYRLAVLRDLPASIREWRYRRQRAATRFSGGTLAEDRNA